MKKKHLTLMAMLVALAMLTGCCVSHQWTEVTCTEPKTCTKCGEVEGEALGHNWVEATCAEPKTCTNCGATEGEALGHTLSEANYQQAAVCSTCGETVGEPLVADFEAKGLTCYTDLDTPIPYTARCNADMNYTAEGTITFSDYQILDEWEGEKAPEGYEIRSCIATIVFDDDNARAYGTSYPAVFTNYYDMNGFNQSYDRESDRSTINYNGIEYDQVGTWNETLLEEWSNVGVYTVKRQLIIQVPVGYDGMVYAFLDKKDTASIQGNDYDCDDIIHKDTAMFRMK